MKKICSLFILLFGFALQAQNKMPYQIYTNKGKKTTYEKMLKAALTSEVVLFGEYHDNSIIHWLQLELTKDVASKKALVLGAEMIETDNQSVLNDYLSGKINQKQMDSLARLWNNYPTDYKPLVDFAKDNKIHFVATNVPRRYASMVFKQDLPFLETLPQQDLQWIAPLPIEFDVNLPGYQAMLKMMGGHAGDKMPKAQAIKDATMAHFIFENLKQNHLFLHFNGTYHSDNYEGIYWYLKKKKEDLKIMTIATISQADIATFDKEQLQKADFIIVVDEDVTKTY
jgi:uncharacterized iron-regulated protein